MEISKKNQEFRKNVLEGLAKRNQALLERTKKNKGYIVISVKGEIKEIQWYDLPDTVDEFMKKLVQ